MKDVSIIVARPSVCCPSNSRPARARRRSPTFSARPRSALLGLTRLRSARTRLGPARLMGGGSSMAVGSGRMDVVSVLTGADLTGQAILIDLSAPRSLSPHAAGLATNGRTDERTNVFMLRATERQRKPAASVAFWGRISP